MTLPFFTTVLKSRFNKAGLLAAVCFAAAAPASADTATRARYLMGTVCEITSHGPESGKAIEAAFAELARLDKVMSLFKDDSELSLVNRKAAIEPVVVSNDLFEVLHAANEVYRFSSGAFDPTYVHGSKALGFKHVILDPNARSVEFRHPNLKVSLDAIGKGFALDLAAKALKAKGAQSALLNFGGQVLAMGKPPGLEAWTVEIAGSPVYLNLVDRSVSTSSQHEQRGHLRDPRNGEAVARKSAVSVITKDGVDADAWSTALFVLGVAKAPKAFGGCALETLNGKIVAQTPSCRTYLAATTKTTKETSK